VKRMMTAIAALTLVAAACGGGDDTSSADPADASSESTTDDVTGDDASTDATADDATADDATADDSASTDEPSAESGDDTDTSGTDDTSGDSVDVDDTTDDGSENNGDDDADGPVINSLNDIPEVCRDAMAEFLRQLEPIVEPIAWENATMGDFEQIANEFEAKAAEFEDATAAAGCDNLNFADDDASGDILIDFARSEAPGAVGFLEFLEDLSSGVPEPGDDGAVEGIETCQDAIDFLQGLVDSYDSISSVPASELMKIPSIASLYADCTLEQLEFFDNPELEEFMNG
jgi:hypothetical protein